MNARKQYSRIGWAYVIFMIVMVAAQILFGNALIYRLHGAGDIGIQMLVSQFTMYGCGFPVFYLLMKRIPAWQMTQPGEISAGRFVLITIFCFGFSYMGSIFGQILMRVIGNLTGSMMTNPVEDLIGDMNPLIMAFTTVIVAPVMEEVMFRKLLIDRIIPFGQKAAILVSGISFGLFHGNFYQFFYASMLGMVFAYIYSRTGKLRYSILLHMIINLVGGMLPTLIVGSDNDVMTMALSFGVVIWMGFCILGAIVLAIVYGRKLFFFPGWESVNSGSLVKKLFTAPGVIGFILICLYMFTAEFWAKLLASI